MGVLGGNENTDQSVLSTRAAAIVARSVEIAAVIANRSAHKAIGKAREGREREPAKWQTL